METKDRTLKTKNKVSVVVVTYNSSPVISECLGSLTNNDSSCLEIIVIDNASTDQKISQRLVEEFPQVKFIQNQKNIGYAAAINQGVKLASGEYVFFMNPDVIISKGTVEKLVSFMESHSDCGACSPYILTPEKSWLFHWIFLRMPIDLVVGKPKKIRGNCYKARFLLGCAVLVRRDFFLKDIGGLDEKFFLYFEDDDLGKKISDCGKSNYIVLSAPAIHFHGKSSATIPVAKREEILAKSRWYFAKKHNLLALKMWCLIYNPIRRLFWRLASWL